MIVPQFWAEARVQQRLPDRQVTVRRFGWSDLSQEDAQSMAEQRAAGALQRILADEKIPRREPRVGYNGADGVPIREEIISRHGDTVITRNSYGALCLNTPEVMFVDVDEDASSFRFSGCLVLFLLLGALGFLGCHQFGNWKLGFLALIPAALMAVWLINIINKLITRRRGGPEAIARQGLERFIATQPDGRFRLYRTPAGFRLMVLHQLIDPRSEAAASIFKACGTDPLYSTMCRAQHCYRARLTPKPWRMGMKERLRPRRTAWPVDPSYLPARAEWVKEYEQMSAGWAACRFLKEYGTAPVHDTARSVQELHDRLCRAEENLPLA
jgi:hypothetical protein